MDEQISMFDAEVEETEMENSELQEYKEAKREKKRQLMVKQKMPYDFKKRYAEIRANEFIEEMAKRDFEAHVSVGGLDSITLYIFLHSIGIKVPGISVSNVEDKSIQKVHRALGIEIVKSYKTKAQVLNEVGFPVISKRIAGKINLLQNPTPDNKTVRHAIITGECGAQGHFAKNSRMKLPLKWLKLFGGYENETEGVHYGKPDPEIKISNLCCYYLKEKPCDDWAKTHNSWPYLGLMASEGGQREDALTEHGCNYYGKTTMRSAPFNIFMRQDILQLALEMNAYYLENIDYFAQLYYAQPYSKDANGNTIPYQPLDTTIPAIYGRIATKEDGELYTTGAQRTGCSMCGFGIHLEERPHRFDRLREQNPAEWHFWMYECCTDENGQKYGWGRVLDYIGVGWEDYPQVQMTLEDYMGVDA